MLKDVKSEEVVEYRLSEKLSVLENLSQQTDNGRRGIVTEMQACGSVYRITFVRYKKQARRREEQLIGVFFLKKK
jgi:hypothetical protein